MKRAALVLLVLSLAAPASGQAGSRFPEVSVGPRPGPDVLYAPPATTPILENTNGWEADPLMVSGASAYRDGEFLYQDFIYDSYGANTTDVPLAPPDTVPASTATLFGGATGDVVYPTDAKAYGFDAADLLEFRARAVDSFTDNGGVEYRITLNTMLKADVAGVAIGIDGDRNASTGKDEWGYGIGSLGHLGLESVIVTWGTSAEINGEGLPPGSSVTVDADRNQIDVTVRLLDPGHGTWRHYVVVGLFDAAKKSFRQILDNPTATDPGGAHGTTPPPVFNVGFRSDEPMGSVALSQDPMNATNSGARASGFGHWRDHGQAKALAARDVSAYHADIDFAKLAEGGEDDSGVPKTGWVDRLFVSRLDLGEGAKTSRPMLLGKIQPYGLYVPTTYDGDPAPLFLDMHSLSCSYNQYAVFMPNQLRQLGEERGSFLLTPEGRGPDGWYHDAGEYDVFEALGDVARNYAIDWDRVSLGGYSMGGYGTYKIAGNYPDLFARGFAVVGPADESILGGPTGGLSEDTQNTLRIADNLRNVPLLMWNGVNDELVPVAGVLQHEQHLSELGLRHELNLYIGYDHFLFGVVDEWKRGADFLGQSTVNRDPEEVVYRYLPEMDNKTLGLVHNHAYWVSDIAVAGTARSALVDARSEATTAGRPSIRPYVGEGANSAQGAYLVRGVVWDGTRQARENALTLSLADVASVTLWIERAGIDPGRPITIVSDSNVAATVTLAGSFGSKAVSVPAGHMSQTA